MKRVWLGLFFSGRINQKLHKSHKLKIFLKQQYYTELLIRVIMSLTDCNCKLKKKKKKKHQRSSKWYIWIWSITMERWQQLIFMLRYWRLSFWVFGPFTSSLVMHIINFQAVVQSCNWSWFHDKDPQIDDRTASGF